MENQNYNLNSSSLYGTIRGTGGVVKDFFEGALALPVACLVVPTFVRGTKEEYAKAQEEGRNYLGLDSFANYWTKSPVMGIGSLFTGASLLVFNSQILDFVVDNPLVLTIPVITNTMSEGYERFRSGKTTDLETKL